MLIHISFIFLLLHVALRKITQPTGLYMVEITVTSVLVHSIKLI